ncbi:MAG: DUF1674 domain-containing protein [Pseudomonadota bacterium]|nr:DUF1674 domain-containing protein [Pseudomonadota bacterium]
MSESKTRASAAGTVRVQEAVPLAELLRQHQPVQVPITLPQQVREIGGRTDGPDPTRYGDWEKNGRCIDF